MNRLCLTVNREGIVEVEYDLNTEHTSGLIALENAIRDFVVNTLIPAIAESLAKQSKREQRRQGDTPVTIE